MNNNPLISVVTVTYNAASVLEETILSVINQTYPNIQYIIIDGGSTDGTIDIIKKYENRISYWISEPDKGIYDAMNKGINKATGEWINFMNAGDSFCDLDVIRDFVKELQDIDADVLYGGVKHIMPYGNKILPPLSPKNILHDMPCSHQAIFIKTSVQKFFLFDLKFKMAADYNLFYNLYNKGFIFRQIPLCIANSEGTGESYKNNTLTMREVLLINGAYNFFIPRLKYEIKRLLFKFSSNVLLYNVIKKMKRYK